MEKLDVMGLKKASDGPRGTAGGFALIAAVSVVFLLAVLAIGFLSLATIQVRSTRVDHHQAEAKANARLALMVAIGELQRDLGPDQRVSTASSLGRPDDEQGRHWTAVYRSDTINGRPLFTRDDLNGGLQDARANSATPVEPINYLVSGNEGGFRVNQMIPERPQDGNPANRLLVVGPGSTNGSSVNTVSVPSRTLVRECLPTGRYAFWVGDLGIKANLAVINPHANETGSSRFFSLLGAAGPNPSGPQSEAGLRLEIPEEEKDRLLSRQSFDLVRDDARAWRRDLFHDITVHSEGVFANVREGGLKRNLTVFLNQENDIPPLRAGRDTFGGLAANDNLVGPANEADATRQGLNWQDTRHRLTSPKFGLLRDWARLADQASLTGNQLAARPPQSEDHLPIPDELKGTSQNLNPSALTNVTQTSLTPILVEGSMFNTFSTHLNPPGSRFLYNIRSHDFPRVVLWNPYSVPITLPPTVAMLQVNGRRGFLTDAWVRTPEGGERQIGFANWLSFGGRTRPDGPVIGSQAYDDTYTGSYYFHLRQATFQPGECLVFLPDRAAEYDGTNVLNNILTPNADYDFANNYYHSASEFDEENPGEVGGMNWFPKRFWYQPSDAFFGGQGQLTQSDDSQMILKLAGRRSSISPPDFDNLPQIAAVSCSLQYGAGREPPEAWYHDPNDPNSGVPVEFLATIGPVVTLPPDRRTRQGYRLRWFQEHPSNIQTAGNALANFPEAWEESPIANWNLRAAYAARSPFENLIGNRGDGVASGPWFFGIYTRDLYDEAVAWMQQTPVRGSDNRNLGNPFGPPFEGPQQTILFDVPRSELGIVSLAQFQHAKLSNYVWHPSYAIGNSLVDPRLGIDDQTGTSPRLRGGQQDTNGFSPEAIGWSTISERSDDRSTWAEFGKGLFLDTPENENVVYDLSFEVNHTLWDNYFLSSGSNTQLTEAAASNDTSNLPNPRVTRISGGDLRDLNDFHRSALAVTNSGAFNVNSTSVAAWKAVLSANRRPDGLTPFPRIMGENQPDWQAGESVDSDSTWNGTRLLTDEEIDRLAAAIVDEVHRRGPFLSLSDFVNRRLSNGPEGRKGALESAIELSGLNAPLDLHGPYVLTNDRSLIDYAHPDNIADSTRMEQTQKPDSKAWGAPVYLTQADLLQAIGAGLSARSDTFVIRAYGESIAGGQVKARAWCEAVVQRIPEPVNPDDTGLNPRQTEDFPDFGRRFRIRRFRWLAPNEI